MEQFNLNWHSYNDHLKEMMQNLLLSTESTDVTLVCEDKTKFQAHKFVLNACSPVFHSIINDMPQKCPIIYLRGVFATEMKSILQFMYLGQVTLYQERMNDFFDVAKSLEIKEISEDMDSTQDQECYEKIQPQNGIKREENTDVSPSNVGGDMKHMKAEVTCQLKEEGQFPCDKCDKKFLYRHGLMRHIKIAHDGIKFPCNDCDYKATTNQSLVIHIQSVHEGIKLPCNLCDYKAS